MAAGNFLRQGSRGYGSREVYVADVARADAHAPVSRLGWGAAARAELVGVAMAWRIYGRAAMRDRILPSGERIVSIRWSVSGTLPLSWICTNSSLRFSL